MNSQKKVSSKPPATSEQPSGSSRDSELSANNAAFAQEVQKLKVTNGQLVQKVVELTRKNLEVSSELCRYKQCFQRISLSLQKFLPVALMSTQFVESIATEVEKISIPQSNINHASPGPNDDTVSLENQNFGVNIQQLPLRTGIARPIVQGHTISNPSISLQRVLPRRNNEFVPMPVRALNLADLVRAGDQNRPLNSVREEQASIVGAENGEIDENEVEVDLSNVSSSPGENSLEPIENGELSVVPEEPAISDDPQLELTIIGEQQNAEPCTGADQSTLCEGSNNLQPISPVEEVTASNVSPRRLARNAKRAAQSDSEEVSSEHSEDEAIELSLIETRRKLMNSGRRKDLQEGTSQDYDERGQFSPNRRRRKRKKIQQEEGTSPRQVSPNETSAIRKSLSGLLNSMKKTSFSRSRKLSMASGEQSPLTSKQDGHRESLDTNPRVSLVRIGTLNLQYVDVPGGLSEDTPAIPPSPMTVMVSRRRGGPYVTTRKRSRRVSEDDGPDQMLQNVGAEEVRESSAAKRKRKSWSKLMRKMSQSHVSDEVEEIENVGSTTNDFPSEVDTSIINSVEAGTSALMDASSETILTQADTLSSTDLPKTNNSLPANHDVAVKELPNIILSRCSDLLRVNVSVMETQNQDGFSSDGSSDTPLALLYPPSVSAKPSTEGSENHPSNPSAKAKPRSKPRSKPRVGVSKKAKSSKSVDQRHSNESEHCFEKSAVNRHDSSGPSQNSSFVSMSSDFDNSNESAGFAQTSISGRPRRGAAPTNYKEKPLNMKMRRT